MGKYLQLTVEYSWDYWDHIGIILGIVHDDDIGVIIQECRIIVPITTQQKIGIITIQERGIPFSTSISYGKMIGG